MLTVAVSIGESLSLTIRSLLNTPNNESNFFPITFELFSVTYAQQKTVVILPFR